MYTRKPTIKETTKYLDLIDQRLDGNLGVNHDEIKASQIILDRLEIAVALGENFFKGNTEATIAIFHELNEEARRIEDKLAE